MGIDEINRQWRWFVFGKHLYQFSCRKQLMRLIREKAPAPESDSTGIEGGVDLVRNERGIDSYALRLPLIQEFPLFAI
jgi:hypothetical protein